LRRIGFWLPLSLLFSKNSLFGSIGKFGLARRAAVRTRVSRVAKWYVVKERRSSYKYDRDVVVGAECLHPESPINEVPSEYGVKNYRYTVVNNR
jgi:hypothetical protein